MSTGQWIGAILGAVVGFLIGGWYGAVYGAIIGYTIGGYIDPVKPDVKQPGAPAPLGLQVMTNVIGNPIYDVLGTAKITGQLLFFGREYNVAVWYRPSKGVRAISGYRYYASWALGICLGVVDCLYTIFRDQDPVWSGELLRPESGGEATIQIEGMGTMIFYFGTDDQVPNVNAGTLLPDSTLNTGHRNLCWAFFDACFINEYNRMPSMSFIVKKIPSLFDEGSKQIQTYDVNPAHALWFTLVQKAGLPEEWVYPADFLAVALTLFSEGRGISILFDTYQSTQNYLEAINSHVDCILRFGSDGKFHPKLIRNDYVLTGLPVIDESKLLEEPSFSRRSWIDTINEVKVQYSEILGERDLWVENIVPHSAYDMASDGVYLYVCGSKFIGPVNPVYSAAVSKVRISDGVVLQTMEYSPVVGSNNWWYAILVDGDYVYLAGCINFPGENGRATLIKVNKLTFGVVWEYKWPVQPAAFTFWDIDHDLNYIYGCASYEGGSAIGRVKVDKLTGVEQWRFQDTYTSPYGMVCGEEEVYLLKHSGGFRTIEKIIKSDGTSTTYRESILYGNYHRGVRSELDLFITGIRGQAPPHGFVSKVGIGVFAEAWSYVDPGVNNVYNNCFVDSEGNIIAVGSTETLYSPTMVKVGASGALMWKKVWSVAGTVAYWALVEVGDYFYVGITTWSGWTSVLQRRLRSTGDII